MPSAHTDSLARSPSASEDGAWPCASSWASPRMSGSVRESTAELSELMTERVPPAHWRDYRRTVACRFPPCFFFTKAASCPCKVQVEVYLTLAPCNACARQAAENRGA